MDSEYANQAEEGYQVEEGYQANKRYEANERYAAQLSEFISKIEQILLEPVSQAPVTEGAPVAVASPVAPPVAQAPVTEGAPVAQAFPVETRAETGAETEGAPVAKAPSSVAPVAKAPSIFQKALRFAQRAETERRQKANKADHDAEVEAIRQDLETKQKQKDALSELKSQNAASSRQQLVATKQTQYQEQTDLEKAIEKTRRQLTDLVGSKNAYHLVGLKMGTQSLNVAEQKLKTKLNELSDLTMRLRNLKMNSNKQK